MSYAPLDESGALYAVSAGPLSEDNPIGTSAVPDDEDRRKSLSEPLTSSNGRDMSDPFYVFRKDLYRQLERVDETLTEYLRVVHQTVRLSFSIASLCRSHTTYILVLTTHTALAKGFRCEYIRSERIQKATQTSHFASGIDTQ